MRKIPFFLLLIMVTAIGFSQPGNSNLAFVLQKGKFSLNAKPITPRWSVAAIQAQLGTTAKMQYGFNITHTYDNPGIVVFEAKEADSVGTGTMNELQIYFSAGDDVNDIVPSGVFTGSLKVDNINITSSLPMDKLRKQLKALKYKETNAYSEHNFRFAKNGIYIYFFYDASEKRLIKTSFGVDKPY